MRKQKEERDKQLNKIKFQMEEEKRKARQQIYRERA